MSWNIVFDKCLEIKNAYMEKFGDISYDEQIIPDENNSHKTLTCLGYWIWKLNNEDYIHLFEPVQVNQNGSLLLIRYGNYASIYGFEEDITLDDFWQRENGFYSECRSLVIDIENEKIVLSPFAKFRNLNEGKDNQIDVIVNEIKNAKSVEITDKLDGSMQSARYYNERIVMSGSQSIDKNNSWRLQRGYELLMENPNYTNMLKVNHNHTFIFELILLDDAHIVKYTKNQEGLYLIGIRNSITGDQLSYEDVIGIANYHKVKTTQIFDKTLSEVLQDTKIYKSDKKEGYVLNIDGHFIKIKCDDYVNIHRILSQISSVNLIIQNIADGTFDDLVSKVPKAYHKNVHEIATQVFDYINYINIKVDDLFAIAPRDNKKEFMLWVNALSVDKSLKGYLICKYLGQDFNPIQSRNGRYRKLHEMKIG